LMEASGKTMVNKMFPPVVLHLVYMKIYNIVIQM